MRGTWFLLFDGSSPDGRGPARFVGRTIDDRVAFAHHQKCKQDPYSTGYVDLVTDDYYKRAGTHDFL